MRLEHEVDAVALDRAYIVRALLAGSDALHEIEFVDGVPIDPFTGDARPDLRALHDCTLAFDAPQQPHRCTLTFSMRPVDSRKWNEVWDGDAQLDLDTFRVKGEARHRYGRVTMAFAVRSQGKGWRATVSTRVRLRGIARPGAIILLFAGSWLRKRYRIEIEELRDQWNAFASEPPDLGEGAEREVLRLLFEPEKRAAS